MPQRIATDSEPRLLPEFSFEIVLFALAQLSGGEAFDFRREQPHLTESMVQAAGALPYN